MAQTVQRRLHCAGCTPLAAPRQLQRDRVPRGCRPACVLNRGSGRSLSATLRFSRRVPIAPRRETNNLAQCASVQGTMRPVREHRRERPFYPLRELPRTMNRAASTGQLRRFRALSCDDRSPYRIAPCRFAPCRFAPCRTPTSNARTQASAFCRIAFRTAFPAAPASRRRAGSARAIDAASRRSRLHLRRRRAPQTIPA